MSKKIYFSPSDQVENTYAVGNTNEAAQCRQIAKYAVEAAKRCGFEAKTDTTTNGSSAMAKRITQSNQWGADVHIPIHTNAHNGQVAGTRMFCYDSTGAGHKICKAIMATLSPITPGESDNITVKHWAEVKQTVAPTVYIEVAFHDNEEEARWIIDHKRDIAEAIVQGLCNYFGVDYVAPAEADKPTTVEKPSTLYRVQVGAYAQRANAEAMLAKLKKAGFKGLIVQAEK